MDITSLPDEMLTNVLKYTKFDTLRKLRKTNRKINKLAKRADIGRRMPVECVICCSLFVEIQEDASFKEFPFNEKDAADADHLLARRAALASALVKSEPQEFIMNDWNFDDELVEVMKEHRASLRCITTMRLDHNMFEMTKENAKFLIQKACPKLDTLFIDASDEKLVQNLCNAEVLGSRRWKVLCIFIRQRSRNNEYEFKFDDEFLLHVAPRCGSFRTNKFQNFTLTGALYLLKKCQQESNLNHVFHLDSIDPEDISVYEIGRFFQLNVQGATAIQWRERRPTLSHCFEITCHHAGQIISLTFRVNQAMRNLGR